MPTKIVKEEDRVKLTKSLLFDVTKEAEDRLIIDFTVQQKDRDNEVLLIDGCDLTEYQKNMIIQADHSFSIRSTVGSFQWIEKYPKSKPDRIRGLPRFASTPFARDVEMLVKEGHVKAISHTFEGFEYTDDQADIYQLGEQYGFDPEGVDKVYLKWAPLEISFVVVQSNTGSWAHLIREGKIKSKIFKDMVEKPEEEFGEEVYYKDEILYSKTEEKPYPNEHSARLKDPKLFDPKTYRRKKDGTIYGKIKVPNTISVIWGKLKEHNQPADNPIPQALRFPKENWTVAQAKKWLKDNNVKFIGFEPATGGKAETFNCECIECGHKLKSEKHCADIKCPECGGKMRRVERPGPGRSVEDGEEEDLYSEENIEKSLKGNSINALMELIVKIRKYTEEAEILAKSISETDQDSEPGSGGQSVDEEAEKGAIVVDFIKTYKRR